MSRFTPPQAAAQSKPADPHAVLHARWMQLTEDLIFAAAYHDTPGRDGVLIGPSGYLRVLTETGRPFDAARARSRAKALCAAINAEAPSQPYQLLKAHAANDNPAFRLRYAHLLPKRPSEPTRAERRTGISEEQRMAEADQAAEDWIR